MFCNSDQDFPACLSKRDVDFLKKEMGEVFKKAKYAVKEIYTSEGVLDFTLFECIESDDISSKQRDRMNKDRWPDHTLYVKLVWAGFPKPY